MLHLALLVMQRTVQAVLKAQPKFQEQKVNPPSSLRLGHTPLKRGRWVQNPEADKGNEFKHLICWAGSPAAEPVVQKEEAPSKGLMEETPALQLNPYAWSSLLALCPDAGWWLPDSLCVLKLNMKRWGLVHSLRESSCLLSLTRTSWEKPMCCIGSGGLSTPDGRPSAPSTWEETTDDWSLHDNGAGF